MSYIAVSIASTAGSIYGANKQAGAYEDAANISAEAADRASARQLAQFEKSRRDLLPWYGAGREGLYGYMSLMGLDMPYAQGQERYYDQLQDVEHEIMMLQEQDRMMADTPTIADAKPGNTGNLAVDFAPVAEAHHKVEGNKRLEYLLGERERLKGKITPVKADQTKQMQMLEQSPDYKFALQESMKAKNYALNRKGLLGSGRADRERQRYAQGMATQQLQNYRNALAGLSGIGQTTGTQIGQFGASAAGAAGRAEMEAGAARASGYQAKGQGYMNMANALSGGLGDYAGYKYLTS